MIPESFIQDLLGKIDIVDVVESSIKLKKAGSNYSACCPFHSEKTPSFTVSPSKQFYHCFGCGANGSAIGFVMEYQGLGFIDAVKQLADRIGMVVPDERTDREKHEGPVSGFVPVSKVRSLVDVMSKAAAFYHDRLLHSQRGVEYCKKRGITSEVAKRFNIGFAPADWSPLKAVFPNYEAPELVEAGLVIEREDGRRYDRFRDRLIIPIVNQKGEVIAFGGRIIEQGEPKYLNSPETPVFEKGKELFGLPQARQAMRTQNAVIVTEGYMDVIALAQSGIENAVAALGTATTASHIQKLLRQADRIIFCFDGDAAGHKAATKAMDNALEALPDNKLLSFAFLPSGEDPDSYVRSQGKAAFEQLIEQAMPLSDFFIHSLSQHVDLGAAEGRSKLVSDAKPLLRKMTAPLLRIQMVKRLAEVSGLTQDEVERVCELRQALGSRTTPAKKAGVLHISLARRILRLVIQNPALCRRLPETMVPDGVEKSAIVILSKLVNSSASDLTYASLRDRVRGMPEESIIEQCAAESMELAMNDDEVIQEFDCILTRLSALPVKQEYHLLREKLESEGLTTEEKARFNELLLLMRRQPEPLPA